VRFHTLAQGGVSGVAHGAHWIGSAWRSALWISKTNDGAAGAGLQLPGLSAPALYRAMVAQLQAQSGGAEPLCGDARFRSPAAPA